MADSISERQRKYPMVGGLADLIGMASSPQRTQQMQGLASFLGLPAVSSTLDRVSYGDPLTTGAGMTTRMRPETAEAAMSLMGMLPAGRAAEPAMMAAGRAGERFAERTVPQIMERGGMGAGLLDALGANTSNVAARGARQLPRDDAFRLAQRRAALPAEQGGLGLPKNNSAMDRAKAMGFDINAFHGSKDPSIMAFDPSMAGKSTSNAFDQNIWATSSPEVARGYSLDTSQFALTPQAQEINAKIQGLSNQYNAAYEAGKFNDMDNLREQINAAQKQSKDLYKSFLKGEIASEGSTIYPLMIRSSELMPYEAEGKNWMRVNRQAIEQANERGYGGVNIRNVSDNTQASDKIISDTYATENPDLIRSRFAAFDPFRKTAATAALMGVAAPDLLAQEVQNTMPQKDVFGSFFGR